MASEHQNKILFLRLLELIDDIHHRDDQNRTILLSIACYFPDVDLLEILLKKGCDVNAVDKDENNALMLLLINDKSKEFVEDEDDSEESEEESEEDDESDEEFE